MFDQIKREIAAREFPHLSDVVYLNTSLTSVAPVRVQQAYREEMERFITSHGSEDEWAEDIARARKGLAKLIGAHEDEIALSNNTTAGIDVISCGYPWDPNKEIILYNCEHASNMIDWLVRQKEGRLRVKLVEASSNGLCADDLINAIDSNTQAVVVSAVQFSDGARIDLKRVGEACAKWNIPLIVDAIQSMGRLRVDVNECNISFLASGCHKGMMIRNGVGFMYCRRDLLEKVQPFNGGYQSITRAVRAYDPGFTGEVPWHSTAARFENGNNNHAGVYALSAALSLIEELGIDDIESEVLRLEQVFLDAIEPAGRITAHGDLPSGIVYIPFEAEQRDKVKEILQNYKIIGTLRPNNLRLCISFMNTDEQMKTAAKAVSEILALA